MCLGVPGKVIEVRGEGDIRMGTVDFGGIRREACLAYIPEVGVGDYVIVHVGFAISKVDEEEAARSYALLAEMGNLEGIDLPPDPQVVRDPAPEAPAAGPRSGAAP
jgi:hydrogenase expression/formation protein HypC